MNAPPLTTPAHLLRNRQGSVSAQVTAIALLLSPLATLANGTRIPNQDAEATARGNAFVATADNPSAIYYNPAGITQLPGLQVLAESYTIFAQYAYTPPGGGSRVQARRKPAVIPQFYTTFTPADSPLSYGLGLYAPFGQTTDWPANSGFDTIATRNEIRYLTLAPTLAWKICESLSVGVGLQINQVHADFKSSQFGFKGDDTSFGGNLGVMWRITEHHVVGLNYQSRSTSRFDGTLGINAFGVSAPASADLAFPDVITLGYSWRPDAVWNLEFAVDRTNWDVLNTAVVTSSLVNVPLPFNWKPSYYYLFGVTRLLPDGWRMSAGYSYSENSEPDANFNPAVPDMARQLASFGVGRTFGAFSCHVTYQHGFTASRTVSGAQSAGPQSPNGRYESTLDAVALSFAYTF